MDNFIGFSIQLRTGLIFTTVDPIVYDEHGLCKANGWLHEKMVNVAKNFEFSSIDVIASWDSYEDSHYA